MKLKIKRCNRRLWSMRRVFVSMPRRKLIGRIADIFFAAASEAMRRILIERARRKSRLKHGGGQVRIDVQELELANTTPDEKVLMINEALERLQAEDPEKARVVVMKFFGGLTNREVAESLNVTERTVERHWAYAKAWLFGAVRQEL